MRAATASVIVAPQNLGLFTLTRLGDYTLGSGKLSDLALRVGNFRWCGVR
jgi:hypothetical protein